MTTILQEFAEKKAELQDLLAKWLEKREKEEKTRETDLIIGSILNEIDDIDKILKDASEE